MSYQVPAICSKCSRLIVGVSYDSVCDQCNTGEEECEACRTYDILDNDGLCRKCRMRWRDNGGCCER